MLKTKPLDFYSVVHLTSIILFNNHWYKFLDGTWVEIQAQELELFTRQLNSFENNTKFSEDANAQYDYYSCFQIWLQTVTIG